MTIGKGTDLQDKSPDELDAWLAGFVLRPLYFEYCSFEIHISKHPFLKPPIIRPKFLKFELETIDCIPVQILLDFRNKADYLRLPHHHYPRDDWELTVFHVGDNCKSKLLFGQTKPFLMIIFTFRCLRETMLQKSHYHYYYCIIMFVSPYFYLLYYMYCTSVAIIQLSCISNFL